MSQNVTGPFYNTNTGLLKEVPDTDDTVIIGRPAKRYKQIHITTVNTTSLSGATRSFAVDDIAITGDYLPSSGGSLGGDLNMQNHIISNLGDLDMQNRNISNVKHVTGIEDIKLGDLVANVLIGDAAVLASSVVYAVVLGRDHSASGQGIVCLGRANTTTGIGDLTVIGEECTVNGDNSVAIGNHLDVTGTRCLALGHYSTCNGDFATVIGGQSTAGAEKAIAIGHEIKNNTANSVVLGSFGCANWRPAQVGTCDLGAPGNEFKNVYAKTLVTDTPRTVPIDSIALVVPAADIRLVEFITLAGAQDHTDLLTTLAPGSSLVIPAGSCVPGDVYQFKLSATVNTALPGDSAIIEFGIAGTGLVVQFPLQAPAAFVDTPVLCQFNLIMVSDGKCNVNQSLGAFFGSPPVFTGTAFAQEFAPWNSSADQNITLTYTTLNFASAVFSEILFTRLNSPH